MEAKYSTDNMYKEEKNPEFHMIRLTEIFCVKNWKFPSVSSMSHHGYGLVNFVTGKVNNDLSVNVKSRKEDRALSRSYIWSRYCSATH